MSGYNMCGRARLHYMIELGLSRYTDPPDLCHVWLRCGDNCNRQEHMHAATNIMRHLAARAPLYPNALGGQAHELPNIAATEDCESDAGGQPLASIRPSGSPRPSSSAGVAASSSAGVRPSTQPYTYDPSPITPANQPRDTKTPPWRGSHWQPP